MPDKNKIIVLSDIHVGTEFPTVWYRRDFHEGYLIKVLDYIIENAASIRELVLLGDIFDFWLYPPDVMPPSFDLIIDANPNILGNNGKLSQVLTALEGNVVFIPGNHDMNITQEDLDKIQNPKFKIKLGPEIYQPDKKIIFTHGHLFTIFNAPDMNTSLKPLPIGYFVSRAYAFSLMHTLKSGQTVADLPDQGYPSGLNIGPFLDLLKGLQPGTSATSMLVDYLAAGMPQDMPINISSSTVITLMQAKALYYDLWSTWVLANGGGVKGNLIAMKSATADYNGTYMAWFAQRLALERGADLVVMGHTHKPKSGLYQGMVNYVNNGFVCPSKPDMASTAERKAITFTEIDTATTKALLFEVVNENGSYKIKDFSAPLDSVVYPPGSIIPAI